MNGKALARARSMVARARYALQVARPRRYLFVFSHMRSYSSLLCHILNSNPEVAGYIEFHHAYRTPMDLVDLAIRVAHMNDDRLTGRYVLDKLLHNPAEVAPEILRRNDLYAIFSIREPEQTIKSTVAMVRRKKKPDWKKDPTQVAAYYVKRLERLVEMAEHKPARSLYFEADLLIAEPEKVLKALDRFLELKEPLTPRYETFEYTGKPRFGDPGKFISSGRIVHERTDYGDITIPEEDLLLAKEAFERTREVLSRSCAISLDRGGGSASTES